MSYCTVSLLQRLRLQSPHDYITKALYLQRFFTKYIGKHLHYLSIIRVLRKTVAFVFAYVVG